ncbi:Fungal specific transcription factor domain-containing protein [Cladophialophora immunda]|nr:Fungal specific transcription factor domain-containing protein [Cladophialophora immunda]
MKGGSNKKGTRSHTFGGCKTCRRRHVKCDKVRPTCLTCRAVGAVCGGFSQELKWVENPSGSGGGEASAHPEGHSVRRYLYTEASRESMSKALRSGFAQKPVDESLSELDARCRDGAPGSANDLAVGPFGAFSLNPPPQTNIPRSDSPRPIVEQQTIDSFQGENALPSVESVGSLSDMHDFLDWPDLFDLELASYDIFPQTFDGEAQEIFPGQVSPVPQINKYDDVELERRNNHHGIIPTSLVSRDRETRVTLAEVDPAEAQLLLTHFKDHVISQLRIMPIEKKSPWEANNLNSAIMTLARLTYMTSQPITHAALVNLQALLALSAKNLAAQDAQHDESSSVYWQDFATSIVNKAKENLQCSLRNETRGTGAAKYKDQLMAILTMLTYAPQTGPNPRLDDFLRLNTPASDSEIEAGAQKDNETGQRDIHLEDSREFLRSMYTELYGISETWLSLVSQTTRLANVIDSLEADKNRPDITYMEAIERRKQRLENMVCSFAAMDRQDVIHQAPSTAQRPSIETARDSMVRALNSALVIFFYRRIRRVNPWILQEHVKSVIRALKNYETSCRDANIQGTGSPWPAFMAGCEALQPSQREYFRDWFDRSFAITGFARLKTAKDCVEEVWRRRDQPLAADGTRNRDQTRTWEQISKERNLHFLLS